MKIIIFLESRPFFFLPCLITWLYLSWPAGAAFEIILWHGHKVPFSVFWIYRQHAAAHAAERRRRTTERKKWWGNILSLRPVPFCIIAVEQEATKPVKKKAGRDGDGKVAAFASCETIWPLTGVTAVLPRWRTTSSSSSSSTYLVRPLSLGKDLTSRDICTTQFIYLFFLSYNMRGGDDHVSIHAEEESFNWKKCSGQQDVSRKNHFDREKKQVERLKAIINLVRFQNEEMLSKKGVAPPQKLKILHFQIHLISCFSCCFFFREWNWKI